MKRYSLRLLVAFVVTSVAVAPLMFWLRDAGFLLVPDDTRDGYLVAISVFDGFALAGLLVMARFAKGDKSFAVRMDALALAFVVCTVIRVLMTDTHPDPVFLVVSALWEAARAVPVAFAMAFVAHAMMIRYLPSTILRVRDITPLLTEDDVEGKATRRVKHAKRSRWIFDMGSREYLDSRHLRLETQDVRGFSWDDWGRVALWASIGLFALSIYAEAYPRVDERFDILWNAIITGHLLAIVPILVLPMLPIKALGPCIPVGEGKYCLANGFSIQLTRWLKVAFFPIIAVGLLFRTLSLDNAVELMQALLVTIPTALLTCMVYITCFRERTLAEVQRGISERERIEAEEFGPEPWTETSLLEGVDIVEADFYLE